MSENDPFTAKSEDGADTRVITHTNGDRTIVSADLDEKHDAELAALSGDELNAAIAGHADEAAAEKRRQEIADATETVVADPPQPLTASTSAAGLAGPDPVRQGGSSTGGEDGAGATFPTTVPAPGFRDAETVKVTEAADPSGGVETVDQGDGGTADPGADTGTPETASLPENRGPNY